MAKIETLVDDFSAGSINGTTWPTVGSGVILTGGHIQITDTTGSYPQFVSATTYDGTSSYVFAQIGPSPVTGGGTGPQQTYFGYYKDTNNQVGMAMGDTHLYWTKTVAGTETDTAIATYNATTMAWWRIRDDGTGLLFGYSSDGVTWTETARQTRPFVLTSVGVYFSVGRYAAGTNPVGTMDNVNTTGSTPKSDSDTGTGTDNAGTVVQKFTGTDTGTGADAETARKVQGTDTGTGADTETARKFTDPDTGTGADTETARKFTDPDTGTGTDNAGTVVQKYTDADTGTGADLESARKIQGTDTGTGADAETARKFTDPDTGTGTDNAGTVVQKYTDADTGTGTDSAGSVVQTNTLSDADTGTGTDSAGTVKLASTDTGTGADLESARKIQGTDTGAGADAETARKFTDPDTGTGTENTGTVVQKYTDTETGTGADLESARKIQGTDTGTGTDVDSARKVQGVDTGTGTDAGSMSVGGPVYKSGSDTVSGTESQTVHTPGTFSQIPSPKTWVNGDDLDHGTLNKEWRDTFNWLLRNTSPAISVYNGDGGSLTYTTGVAIPLKTEELKRGNLVHATNDTKVYVYEPGWYYGIVNMGASYTSVTAGGTTLIAQLKVNGLVAATGETDRIAAGPSVVCYEFQFSYYLNAGDYVEIAMGGSWTGTLTGGVGTVYAFPRLDMWWRNN